MRKRKAIDMTEDPPYAPEEITARTTRPAETTTRPPPPSLSRLTNLPPELRNAIFTLVLSQPEPIRICDRNSPPPEPALLRVNRQIRREASPIYYRANNFKVYIYEFDAGLYRRWYNSSGPRRAARKEYVIRDSTNWCNLLDWLKAYYHGESGKPGAKRSGRPCISAAMFSLVQRMKRHQRLSWEQVAENLEDVHKSLIATDSRWA